MNEAALPSRPRRSASLVGWRRVGVTLGISIASGLLLSTHRVPPWTHWAPRAAWLVTSTIILGLGGMLVFGLLERWPRSLPRWLERWVLQVLGVALTMPIACAALHWLTDPPGAPHFHAVPARTVSFWLLTVLGLLVAPWTALGALVRQKEALARNQALAFELARSELERQASDARLRLLQAQVAPHFLFNTLANIQALVDAGSPQARGVLRSLIAYLRAAVPRLNEPATTLGQELELVQAYLELMHMRMPDRLRFSLRVDDAARPLHCPPMTLLTLVENAVRHGIDPSEEGGSIEIEVERNGDRCLVRVRDTGAGLRPAHGGLGTGLATLRERLQLAFGDEAGLRVAAEPASGVTAELEFPVREAVDR
jgi:hypothetical protein